MKKLQLFFVLVLAAGLLVGCQAGETSREKVRDLEYTVVPEEDIPEELLKIINEKKTVSFEFSYAAEDSLYIAVGYGEQKTGGYSIVLEELFAAENAVIISTILLGPGKDEKVEELATYPYIVVKTEFIDLTVEYE